jgi:glycosyltransferase involved in cell wall biosynthesis
MTFAQVAVRETRVESDGAAPSMKRVVHMTSAHPRNDTRILFKMCRSLADAGWPVTLVVADGLGPEKWNSIEILDVGSAKSRLDRMIGSVRRVQALALELDADIYHFHDPELLPVGALLRRRKKTVIYDAHEDLGKDILSKPYLPGFIRPLVAKAAEMIEHILSSRMSAVIGATPIIARKFRHQGNLSIDINNFPILDELRPEARPADQLTPKDVCYVGGIGALRGIREMVNAMPATRTGARLLLAGEFSEVNTQIETQALPGWIHVEPLGVLGRPEVRAVFARAAAGLVTLHPTPAYKDALPVKMFEYMSAGLPVIASDFPLWRSIINDAGCGLLVDPLDPAAIAAAIDWVIEHPDGARAMGDRGRRAVLERYNWAREAEKLVALYWRLSTPGQQLTS